MAHEWPKQGRWRLPGSDRETPGLLSFDESHGWRLTLDGCLGWERDNSRVSRLGPATEPYPSIHGEIEGTEVTLLHGIQTSLSDGISWPTEVVEGNQLLLGTTMFESDEDVVAIEVRARLRNGVDWADPAGIEDSWDEAPTVWAVRRPERVIELDDGDELIIRQLLGVTGDGIRGREVTQEVDFAYRAPSGEFCQLDELVNRIGSFADLVSIGVGHAATFDRVDLIHPEVRQEMMDGSFRGPIPIEVKTAWRDWSAPEGKAIPRVNMFFTSDQVPDEDLRSWMSYCCNHRLLVRHLMATRHAAGFVDDRIRSWMAVMSDLQLSIAGISDAKQRPKTVDQLEQVAATAGERFADLVGDVERWSKEMRSLRNAMVHTTHERPASDERRFWLSESLYWLLVGAVLRQAGISGELVDGIYRHRTVRFTFNRLAALA
jgi:hypothetical protein